MAIAALLAISAATLATAVLASDERAETNAGNFVSAIIHAGGGADYISG